MPEIDVPIPGRRPTRLIVDGDIIERNATLIRGQLSPGTRLMAVVKANAYGHGAVGSARAALRGGASYFGVATVGEACELREAGITSPILVLGSSDPSEAPIAAGMGVAIGVGDAVQAERLLSTLEDARLAQPLVVHLKIDTGMRRFGVEPSEAPALTRSLDAHPRIHLEGIYSHFAESDDATMNRMDEQLGIFLRVRQTLADLGIQPELAHISNSGALLRNRAADLNMVRAGICLYGISPSEDVKLFDGMAPALEWRATVQHIVRMLPGARTGYGGTYVATEHERIAILPIGYADGYPRALSNLGWVGFRGCRLPVRGRISMDQCAVGIPPGLHISVGDEVTMIGTPESGAPSANEQAASIGTIGYEIVSRLSRRIPLDFR